MSDSRCGFVALVGRPNVGKSTLLNHLLGQKLSITSRKPQTTRHRVLGIKTEGDHQIIYVDTPGLHRREERAINRYMNRAADSALSDVDLVLFLVDGLKWTDEDEWVLGKLQHLAVPVILVINKIDKLADKQALLPHIAALSAKMNFAEVFPLSALKGHNRAELEAVILQHLPEGPQLFPADQVTDRSERFLAAEMVREKIMRQLGAEVPYAMAVEIEAFEQHGEILHISAVVFVERSGQKRILIGDKGERLRLIGQEARRDMERLFDRKVMLNLWVKLRAGWSDDERALRSLGYGDDR